MLCLYRDLCLLFQEYADGTHRYDFDGSMCSYSHVEKGIEIIRNAAEKGNADAQCNLGICYYKGQGVERDLDKAKEMSTIKQASKSEYGDSIKYVNFASSNNNGEIVDVVISLNQDKIDEDLQFAGYNLLVTSEINKSAEEIYNTYHGLWRIEESFRVMKTYLEARPVYLQKVESIYGHFTICYLALTLLRLLELKVFNDELPISQLIEFIRNYTITEIPEGSYINNAIKSKTLNVIKKRYCLSNLDNAYLKKKDVENILNAELFFD